MNYPIRLFDEEGFIESTELFRVHTPPNYDAANKLKKQLVITNITETDYKPNKETIGFRLDSGDVINFFNTKEAIVHPITNIYDFTKHLIRTLKEYQNHTHLNDTDISRTIFLDVSRVRSTGWNISNDLRKEIKRKAYDSTKEYLEKFNIYVPEYTE
ncbi:hypothetical protein [Peribacillus deserti]|uniref:Uncharacterized protein n=1 Tax=Peribacillus deserti TaxID=673318 RepID=A0A2N5M1E7_9BACI|nr:hypothetical protein [Peribacillus deserti]PLT28179.1 hypothetical protein CUU66_19750 [Peribacillus deserti]